MLDTKILVVDDDANICDLLKLYFENEGYEVKTANDGMEGISFFKLYEPDLVLLDIMLPKKDGWQVCREIREMSSKPVIMITAKGEVFDKVLGLELGADDFVVKPFDMKELSARVKAVLRRYSAQSVQNDEEVIKFENIEISLQKYELKLKGKTVGIIGLGKIGTRTAEILNVFGCKVLAQSRTHHANAPEYVEQVSQEELLKRSDIVVLHCPLNEETHHMINADSIARMKKGVVIINTSRGGLVNSEDLIQGLKSGKIGAACLDVYEEEGDVFYEDLSGHILQDDKLVRLIAMPNVIVTSHQAFLTREALDNIASTTVNNLLRFASGDPDPITEVVYQA